MSCLDMLDMSEHVWTCPDTVDTGALHAKICSGDLSGSGLRKYALRQNHTIPVETDQLPRAAAQGSLELRKGDNERTINEDTNNLYITCEVSQHTTHGTRASLARAKQEKASLG